MEFFLHINQAKALEWGLNLQQAAVFSFIYSAAAWANKEGEFWNISKTKLIEELPILTSKLDTVYRLVKILQKKGLIEHRLIDGKDFYRVSGVGLAWNIAAPSCSEINPRAGNKSETRKKIREPEINPTEVGKKSEEGRKNIRDDLGKISDVSIYQDNQYTKDQKHFGSSPVGDEPAPVENSEPDNPRDPEPEPVDPIEQEFDQLKAMYPPRNGSNPWKAKNGALGAYRARRAEGHAFETIRAGVSRYAAWCAATGKVGTETVMQAKRFFGPGEEFLNPWTPPPAPGPPGGSPPGSRSTRDRSLQEDLQDDSWVYDDPPLPPNHDWVQDYIEGEMQ